MQKRILSLLLICAFFMSAFAGNGKKSEKNIVVFIADDLAWNELSCYGGQNVKTPNIDALAEHGVQFNHMYSSTSMCCPTRASIYTGLYPMHHGVTKNHAPAKSDIKSVGHYLGDMGYRVGLTGKTHFRPKSVYPFQMIEGFIENCVSPSADYTTDGIERFMSEDERPFCLYVCSTNPHVPWTAGDPTKIDRSALKLNPVMVDNPETREAFARYLAEVVALDQQLGDVVASLKKTGKYDNTMIIFCGEQGPQYPGGKWTCWDYGQKSAFIVKYPGKGEKPIKTNALVQYEDLLPTMIDYLGGKIPEGLDGKSFLSVLEGKTQTHREWVYGIHNNIPEGTSYPIRCIRNTNYKLILNLRSDLLYYEKHLMGLDKENYWKHWVRDARVDANASKLVLRYLIRPETELYNLEDDPWELNNLAIQDDREKERFETMKNELLQWMDSQGDKGAEEDQK